MANITITIPDAQAARVQTAFARRVGKDPADVTLADVKAELIDLVKIIVRQSELEALREAVVVTDVDPA